MEYALLFILVLCVSAQGVLAKQYNIKAKAHDIFMYTFITVTFALLFFVFGTGGKLILILGFYRMQSDLA